MSNSKVNILILEDDETLGLALKEIFSRDGQQVYLAARPDEATTIIATSSIDFLFCDCLLPQMTGLDFVDRTRQNYPQATFKVVLMSGIYTEKQFIQEAVRKTQAIAFLRKPFEMAEALKLVVKKDDTVKKEEASARKLFYQMFANPKVTSRQKRKVIESVEEVSGFDLPFLYSLLVETKSSGYLNIYSSNGAVSGVSFCNGNIVGVDVDDKATFLGEMLIQSGYATPEDVQNALRDKVNRRIGNFLIQSNQLSPHAFDLILMEQMNIRLVRTIVDQKVRVNFVAAELDMMNPSIDTETLSLYLHDWIASKITVSWLKPLYIMWAGNVIVKSPTFHEDHPALQMSLVKSLEGLSTRLNDQMSLNQLLDIKGYSELAVYKAIHFLLTKGLIVFAPKTAFATPEAQLHALQKIWVDLEGKNGFQVVEYLESSMGAGNPNRMLEDFMTLLGEEPMDPKSEVFALWKKIKKVTEEAVSMAHDTVKIDQIRQAAQRSEAEGKMQAGSLMEEVKKSLQLNQYAKSMENLLRIAKLNPQTQQLHIYNSWAKLGMASDPAKRSVLIKEVELELLQVPPDERYDALFPFIMGLLNKTKGDLLGAKKSFEKSIAMDSSFIPARRELSILSAQNKKQDVFNMDLKEMVSGFFKKK